MKIILGYKGAGDRLIALQQGELQGNCGMNVTTVMNLAPQMLADGELVPIMQSGLHPHPLMPNVPLTQSFGQTDRERVILTSIYSQQEIARVFAAPPGTPKDRVAILRQAIMDSMKDPLLVKDAKSMKLDLDPMSGEDAAKIVSEMANLTPDLKADVRKALGE
jgi:tripartite-type tricarboxylate transporter receptor subunit TctC